MGLQTSEWPDQLCCRHQFGTCDAGGGKGSRTAEQSRLGTVVAQISMSAPQVEKRAQVRQRLRNWNWIRWNRAHVGGRSRDAASVRLLGVAGRWSILWGRAPGGGTHFGWDDEFCVGQVVFEGVGTLR